MAECPWCGQPTGPEGCWPWDPPDSTQLRGDVLECWERHDLPNFSEHLGVEVWRTKGEAVSVGEVGLLERVRAIERGSNPEASLS